MKDPITRIIRGRVFTGVPGAPMAEAVAVAGGRILSVGDRELVEAAAGSGAEPVDVRDGLVCAAFQDAHIHLIEGSLFDIWCNLHDVAPCRYEEVVGDYAAGLAPGAWVRGGGWSMAAFENGSPTTGALDRACGDRPAYLTARDGHSAWVNGKTLELLGIGACTPDPPGGRIERDAAGNPTGTLHETAMRLAQERLPTITTDEWARALLLGRDYMHSLGITAWQEARMSVEMLEPYLRIRPEELNARVSLALHWDPALGLGQIDRLKEMREMVRGHGSVVGTTVKIFVDGVLENRTAALSAPYAGSSPPVHGQPLFTAEELREVAVVAAGAGFPLHFHAIGDWAVHQALNACEHAGRVTGQGGLRHQIAHLHVVDPRDIPRFAELGVSANLQPYWACRDEQMELLDIPALGEERVSWQYPFRSLERAGAMLAMGSDWRVSTPDPLKQIEVAVTRRQENRPDEPPLEESEALSLESGLLGFTRGAAFTNLTDDETGTIEVGKSADLVVVSPDPFELAPHEIGQAQVAMTMYRGNLIHRKAGTGAWL